MKDEPDGQAIHFNANAAYISAKTYGSAPTAINQADYRWKHRWGAAPQLA
jgi:hypothetical protein